MEFERESISPLRLRIAQGRVNRRGLYREWGKSPKRSFQRGFRESTKARRHQGKAGSRAGELGHAVWTQTQDFLVATEQKTIRKSQQRAAAGFSRSVFSRSNQQSEDSPMVLPARTIAPALRPAFPLSLCVLVLIEPIRHDPHRPLTGSARLSLLLVPLCLGGEPDSPSTPRHRAGGPSWSAGRGRR